MKKLSFALLPLALFAMVSCGGTPASTGNPTTSAGTTTAGDATTVEATTTEEITQTVFEKQYTFFSYGSTAEGEELDNLYDTFEKGKHKGPNYMLYINLLKDGNKVEAGRKTMYYTGILANKTAFSTVGTWTVADGVYTINLDAFTYNVKGTGEWENAANTLTTAADGTVTWNYEGCKKNEGGELVANPYETTLMEKVSFAGEYSGTYYSLTDMEATGKRTDNVMDSMEVVAVADGTFTVTGSIEDSGISSFTGTIDTFGVFVGETPRLGGTMQGLFYTEKDGKAHFYFNMEARERQSIAYGTSI